VETGLRSVLESEAYLMESSYCTTKWITGGVLNIQISNWKNLERKVVLHIHKWISKAFFQ
jgi:hypothetical protein